MSKSESSSVPLQDVEVFAFDVFGTVVDWLGTGIRVLKEKTGRSPTTLVTTYTDTGAWNSTTSSTTFFAQVVPTERISFFFCYVRPIAVTCTPKDWEKFMKEWRAGYIKRTCA